MHLLGDLAATAELGVAEDHGGEMGERGEEEEPGEVMLIWAQLEARLSSLGVLSTVILGIRPSIERERTPIPTGEGERDRRRPEKLVPLCKTSMSSPHQNRLLLIDSQLARLSIMVTCQVNAGLGDFGT